MQGNQPDTAAKLKLYAKWKFDDPTFINETRHCSPTEKVIFKTLGLKESMDAKKVLILEISGNKLNHFKKAIFILLFKKVPFLLHLQLGILPYLKKC